MIDSRYAADMRFLREGDTDREMRALREGVMDYKHTPTNLQNLASKNPLASPRTSGVSDDDYLRKHGARLPAPRQEDNLLAPANRLCNSRLRKAWCRDTL